jgi:hypothetical protein
MAGISSYIKGLLETVDQSISLAKDDPDAFYARAEEERKKREEEARIAAEQEALRVAEQERQANSDPIRQLLRTFQEPLLAAGQADLSGGAYGENMYLQQSVLSNEEQALNQGTKNGLDRDAANQLYQALTAQEMQKNPALTAEQAQQSILGNMGPSGGGSGTELASTARAMTAQEKLDSGQTGFMEGLQDLSYGSMNVVEDIKKGLLGEKTTAERFAKGDIGSGVVNFLLGDLVGGLATIPGSAGAAIADTALGYGRELDDKGKPITKAVSGKEQSAKDFEAAADVLELVPGAGLALRGATLAGKTAKEIVKIVGKEALGVGAIESGTEGIQSILGAMGESRQATPEEITTGMVTGLFGGALFGGAASAGGIAGARAAEKRQEQAFEFNALLDKYSEAVDAPAPAAEVDAAGVNPLMATGPSSAVSNLLQSVKNAQARTAEQPVVTQNEVLGQNTDASVPEMVQNVPLTDVSQPNVGQNVPQTEQSVSDVQQEAVTQTEAPLDNAAVLPKEEPVVAKEETPAEIGSSIAIEPEQKSEITKALKELNYEIRRDKAGKGDTFSLEEAQANFDAILTEAVPSDAVKSVSEDMKAGTVSYRTATELISALEGKPVSKTKTSVEAGKTSNKEEELLSSSEDQLKSESVSKLEPNVTPEVTNATETAPESSKTDEKVAIKKEETPSTARTETTEEVKDGGDLERDITEEDIFAYGTPVEEAAPKKKTKKKAKEESGPVRKAKVAVANKEAEGGFDQAEEGDKPFKNEKLHNFVSAGTGELVDSKLKTVGEYEKSGVVTAEQQIVKVFKLHGRKGLQALLEDTIDPSVDFKLLPNQVKLIEDLNRTGSLKLNKLVSAATKIVEGSQHDAAVLLRMSPRYDRVRVRAGKGTKAEMLAGVNRVMKKYKIELTEDQLAFLDTMGNDYEEAATRTTNALTAAENAALDKNVSEEVKRAIIEKILQAQVDVRVMTGTERGFVFSAFDKSMPKAKAAQAKFEYMASEGLYYHDWIDSSILSAISGRFFDQLNGWTVVANELAPWTFIVNKVAASRAKKAGYVGGEIGIGSLKSVNAGRKFGLQTAVAENAELKAIQEHLGGLVTVRRLTTLITRAGDMPIEAKALSYTHRAYKTDPEYKNASEADLVILCHTDPKNIHEVYREISALDQGLSAKGLGMSVSMRKGVMDAFDLIAPGRALSFKRNFAKLIERSTIGFIGVSYRVTRRGTDMMFLGATSVIKAQVQTRRNSDYKGSFDHYLTMRQALADCTSGAMLWGAGVALGMNGIMTLGYPDDPEEQATWEQQGKRPYSVKIPTPLGEFYWDMTRLAGVFAMPIIAGAIAADCARTGKDLGEAFGKFALGIWGSFSTASGIDNISNSVNNMIKLSQGQVSSGLQRQLGGMLSMVQPLSSLTNQLTTSVSAKLEEPLRDPVGFLGIDTKGEPWLDFVMGVFAQTANKSPARFLLPIKTDAWGQAIKANPLIMFGSIGMAVPADNPAAAEVVRLDQAGFPAVQKNDGNTFEVNGEKVKLSNVRQVEFDNAIGAGRLKAITEWVETDEYKAMTDEQKAASFKTAGNIYTNRVKNDMAKKFGYNADIPENATLVSSDIGLEEANALQGYAALSGDERAKWLETPKNAYFYYKANYDNKKANGTLLEKDKDLRSTSSSLYKYLEAKVDYENGVSPELIYSYSQTSLEEWRELKETNPELAQQLLDYDNKRTAVGVSGKSDNHSSNKYYDKKSGSGGGGGGGGSTSIKVASVADLRQEQYFAKGNSKSSTVNQKLFVESDPNRPASFKPSQKVSPGKGITTKIPRLTTAETIKYKPSETRQPSMGQPYSSYLSKKSPQDSFKAKRESRR